MFIKIAGDFRNLDNPYSSGFDLFETTRVHYYKSTWGQAEDDEIKWDLTFSTHDGIGASALREIPVIVLDFPFGPEQRFYRVVFDTFAYIMNDEGKTIECLDPRHSL